MLKERWRKEGRKKCNRWRSDENVLSEIYDITKFEKQ